MIGVEEAKRLMMTQAPLLPFERFSLDQAFDLFTAAEIISPHDHPLFDMSAVDGYAFAFDDVSERDLVGEVAAGQVFNRPLDRGECVRIFTGAMLPEGADTVVMQEFARKTAGRVEHTDTKLAAGANVRKRGEQLRKDDMVLSAGAPIDTAAIGLLASVGVVELEARRRPTVGVITTGGEFADPAAPAPGRVFNSNGVMLRAALVREAEKVSMEQVDDDERLLSQTIQRMHALSDVVITTGGASVGDHDLIKPTLMDLGAIIHFHGVAQKPGKPMLFATLNGKPIFGLPGNPRAVMVLFWEYVVPFLRAMQGAKDPWLKTDRLRIDHAVAVKGDRAEFRAAQVKDGRVTLLGDEGSHMLRSLVDADALACIPADVRALSEGDPVEVHYLPR